MRKTGIDPFEELDKPFVEDITDSNADEIDNDPITSNLEEDLDEPSIPEAGEEGDQVDNQGDKAPEYDVNIEGNPIYLIASQWQKEGKLPEDFEIKEDISEEEFTKAFYDYKEKFVMNDLEGKVLDRLMQEEGLTPEALQSARLFHFGVQQEDYGKLQIYNALANIKISEDSETFDKDFQDLGLAYYIDKGFTEEQASRYVKRDADEDDVNAVLSEYENHFKGAFNKQKQEIERTAEQGRMKEIADREENLKFINTTLESKKIDGSVYSKEQIEYAKKAMFEKTELIRDHDGRTRLVTLEQKKILEAKENREKKLKHRIDFILGIDYKSVVEEATKKAKNSLTRDLKSMVKATPRKEETVATQGKRIHEFEREL